MRVNAIMKAPREGAMAAAVRGVYEWLTRTPEIREDVVQTRSAPEIERLTPKAIADATARLMWAQRGSLKVEVKHDGYEQRGVHCLEKRHHVVTIPGGITVAMMEGAYRVTITAPDGQQETVETTDATGVNGTWNAIQGIAIMETMGLTPPEQQGGMRPSRILMAISQAIGDMVERADLQRADGTYERRMSTGEEEYSDKWAESASPWKDIGPGVHVDLSGGTWEYGARKTMAERTARVMMPSIGVVLVPYGPINDGFERRKRNSFAAALGIAHELPVHLPAPRGNAQASRVLQLCREAVASEPDLVDASGTPIAPLVNKHLPELMRRHAEAAASAPADQLAAIDAELMTGIEGVRLAVDEALLVSANVKRDALRTQLAFLEMRHPQDPDRKALASM
jgi:hypothetical protein